MEKIFIFFLLLCFILVCMKNILFLLPFGLLFIIAGFNKIKTFNNIENAIAYEKRKYENYKIGIFQKKILLLEEKIRNILFVSVGFSLCLWYIFYLIIKYIPSTDEFILGFVLPLNILIFPLFLGVFYLAYALILRKHKIKYNTRVLAQCINVEESSYTDQTENFSQRIVEYITTYKFNYNDNEYTVSTILPHSYLYVPKLGSSYELFINKNDPSDFLCSNDNEEKKHFILSIVFLVLSLFMLFCMICVWIKYI